MAAGVRFLQSSLMFRSLLEQQTDFGPMESQQSQQVRACTRHALLPAHEGVPEFSARVRIEPLTHVNVEEMRTDIASFGTLGSRDKSMARWRRVATVLAQTRVLLYAHALFAPLAR